MDAQYLAALSELARDFAAAFGFAEEFADRKDGEEWETNGRWYKRKGQRTVRIPNPKTESGEFRVTGGLPPVTAPKFTPEDADARSAKIARGPGSPVTPEMIRYLKRGLSAGAAVGSTIGGVAGGLPGAAIGAVLGGAVLGAAASNIPRGPATPEADLPPERDARDWLNHVLVDDPRNPPLFSRAVGRSTRRMIELLPPRAARLAAARVASVSHEPELAAGGTYNASKSHLRANPRHVGGRYPEFDPQGRRVAHGRPGGVLPHELAHAVDDALGRISQTGEWRHAYVTEMPHFGRYGNSNPGEGWSEFARLVWWSGVSHASVAEHFPRMTAIFKREGLWPTPEQEAREAANRPGVVPPRSFWGRLRSKLRGVGGKYAHLFREYPEWHAFAWKQGSRGGRYWLPSGKQDVPANRLYGARAEKAATAGRSRTTVPSKAEAGPGPEPGDPTPAEIAKAKIAVAQAAYKQAKKDKVHPERVEWLRRRAETAEVQMKTGRLPTPAAPEDLPPAEPPYTPPAPKPQKIAGLTPAQQRRADSLFARARATGGTLVGVFRKVGFSHPVAVYRSKSGAEEGVYLLPDGATKPAGPAVRKAVQARPMPKGFSERPTFSLLLTSPAALVRGKV